MPEIIHVAGARGYMFQGVFFSEGFPNGASSIRECSASSNVQNTNLDWLREKLATQVKNAGGNVLMGFSYVQKANVFSFSSVSWNASGTAAMLPNLEALLESGQGLAAVSTHRPCPFCAEEILVAAKKCKHCGEFIPQE